MLALTAFTKVRLWVIAYHYKFTRVSARAFLDSTIKAKMKVIKLETYKARLHTTSVVIAAKYQGGICKIALDVAYDLSQEDDGSDVIEIDSVATPDGLELLERLNDSTINEITDKVLEQLKAYREDEKLEAALANVERKQYA